MSTITDDAVVEVTGLPGAEIERIRRAGEEGVDFVRQGRGGRVFWTAQGLDRLAEIHPATVQVVEDLKKNLGPTDPPAPPTAPEPSPPPPPVQTPPPFAKKMRPTEGEELVVVAKHNFEHVRARRTQFQDEKQVLVRVRDADAFPPNYLFRGKPAHGGAFWYAITEPTHRFPKAGGR